MPRRTLSSLFADGWGCVPSLLAWGFSVLIGGARFFPKWQPPGEFTLIIFLGCLPPMSCPHSEPQLPPAFPDLSRPTGRSHIDSYRVLALPWDPMHLKPCVHLPRVESVSPSPVELLHTSPAGLQHHMLLGLLPLLDPQTGEPDVGVGSLTPLGELLHYSYFPVCGLPPWQI